MPEVYKVVLIVVILGGLLWLEAGRGYVEHRGEQLRVVLRDLAWATKDVADSTERLGRALQDSQHAWGQAIDLVVRERR